MEIKPPPQKDTSLVCIISLNIENGSQAILSYKMIKYWRSKCTVWPWFLGFGVKADRHCGQIGKVTNLGRWKIIVNLINEFKGVLSP